MGLTPLDDEITLPLLPKLGIKDPLTVTDNDVKEIASSFIQSFSDAITTNVESVVSLFFSDCLWRDLLAFTWEFNTFFRVENVRNMLAARMEKIQVSNIRLSKHRDLLPSLFNPAPVLLMIHIPFEFDTAAGSCTGIAKLVPVPSDNGIKWKIYTLFTNLNQIKGCPDRIGPNRHTALWNYRQEREKELAFEHEDPKVLIIGGGHSSLAVAARLKAKDIPCLVVEKNPKIGDNWRNRYNSLTFHDFSYLAVSPYLSYPATWPLFTPSEKYADWLEFYVKALDLNVWTSTTVTKAERDDANDEWIVHVTKADGTERIFHSRYIVAGMGLGDPYTPEIPGMDKFTGKVMHAYAYKNPKEHIGKKVVVVGSATAGHDISQDHCEHGIDVTMVQRSSTCVIRYPEGIRAYLGPALIENDIPVEIKDQHTLSFPIFVAKKLQTLAMKRVIEQEKPFYDALEKVGFKVNHGVDNSGFFSLGLARQGGFYISVSGGSQLIIDGKIKLKSGSIQQFTSEGMVFEDGSTLNADVVIFATGLTGATSVLSHILSPEDHKKIHRVELSNEGELEGAYRECGLPNLFIIAGNLPLCRVYSSHIALIIKGKEEKLFNGSYKYTKKM